MHVFTIYAYSMYVCTYTMYIHAHAYIHMQIPLTRLIHNTHIHVHTKVYVPCTEHIYTYGAHIQLHTLICTAQYTYCTDIITYTYKCTYAYTHTTLINVHTHMHSTHTSQTHILTMHTYTYNMLTYTHIGHIWGHREGSHLQTKERGFRRNQPKDNLTGALLLEPCGSDSIFSPLSLAVEAYAVKLAIWFSGWAGSCEPVAACLPTAAVMVRLNVWKPGGWNHVHAWSAKTWEGLEQDECLW